MEGMIGMVRALSGNYVYRDIYLENRTHLAVRTVNVSGMNRRL
jgi:hypothetical protein